MRWLQSKITHLSIERVRHGECGRYPAVSIDDVRGQALDDVAVISNEHVNSSTVVKWLCMRNGTESVMISCRFRYLLSPPSNLYMIASVCR